MKSCLLITEEFEPTADILIAELRARNVPCLRWNLDRYPLGSALSFQARNGEFTTEIISDGRRLDLADIGSIWCRGFRPLGLPDTLVSAERVFAETEAQRTLDALLTIPDVLWINHPQRYTAANSKPAQLFAAQRLGFEIPPTLVSNDPGAVRTFIGNAKGPVVYKAMSQSLEMEAGKALFTGIITQEQIAGIDSIRLTPGVFQHLVSKAYELRITVVGSEIFAAKIHSQAHPESSLDWRHVPLDLEHEAVRLDPDVSDKINCFMRRFGLVYGAFDFVVTPDGRHVSRGNTCGSKPKPAFPSWRRLRRC